MRHKILYFYILFIIFLVKAFLFAWSSSSCIRITTIYPTKSAKGATVPILDKELYQYITNVDFVMSDDKKSAIAIMDVPEENKAEVEAIIAKKNNKVTEDNMDEMEKKYHGLKKRMEKHKNK